MTIKILALSGSTHAGSLNRLNTRHLRVHAAARRRAGEGAAAVGLGATC
ncbi:hypothetical protein [Piscinibacter sp. XHJ-5]|nr:hypothetical protein [Piscinibacter sp. XHJ-5]